MKRKVHVWSDTGELEFSPPLDEGVEMVKWDFVEWYDKKEYKKLPTIDNDELLKEYEALELKLYEVRARILGEMQNAQD